MLKWFGPHGFTATSIELDVRVGGGWRGGMRGPDGKELIASGTYQEVVPNQRLVFSYAWENAGVRGHETVCQLELTDDAGQTRMTFTQGPFETKPAADDHNGGWSEAFEKLAATVAR